jgi:hypothetical protein
MPTLKMRPTFAVDLPLPADEAAERISEGLEIHDSEGPSASLGRCTEFSVPRRDRRIWSPHLSVQVEDAGSASLLRGRFAPRPEIWTFLMFLYFTTGTLAFFGAMYGYAQWMIGQRPWALITVPAGLSVIALLHGTSVLGQVRARHQMEHLRGRLNGVLREAFGIEV